jgi:hypothetical protein
MAESRWTRESTANDLTIAVLGAVAFAKRVRTTRRSRSFASRCCRRYNADIGDYPTTTLLTAPRVDTRRFIVQAVYDTWEIYPASHDVDGLRIKWSSKLVVIDGILRESLRAGFNACLANAKLPLGTIALLMQVDAIPPMYFSWLGDFVSQLLEEKLYGPLAKQPVWWHRHFFYRTKGIEKNDQKKMLDNLPHLSPQ